MDIESVDKKEFKKKLDSHVYCKLPWELNIEEEDDLTGEFEYVSGFFESLDETRDILKRKLEGRNDVIDYEKDSDPMEYFEWWLVSDSFYQELCKIDREFVVETKYGPVWGLMRESTCGYVNGVRPNSKFLMALDTSIFPVLNGLEEYGYHIYPAINSLIKDVLGGSQQFGNIKIMGRLCFNSMRGELDVSEPFDATGSPFRPGSIAVDVKEWRLVSEEFAKAASDAGEIVAKTLETHVWCRQDDTDLEALLKLPWRASGTSVQTLLQVCKYKPCSFAATTHPQYSVDQVLSILNDSFPKKKRPPL